MDFNAKYDRQVYLDFLSKQFLPEDFHPADEQITPGFTIDRIQGITQIGQCESLELTVYEIEHESENDPRVTLSRETFKLLAELGVPRALVLFVSPSDNYRLSLVTVDLEWESGKRVKKVYSNPRRYSFFLGPDARTNTPYQYLVDQGRVIDFDDFKQRFSIEVVNKQFYRQIATLFTELTGGQRDIGSRHIDAGKGCLVLPGAKDEKTKKEFAVRLIGRLVFCWFLKKKDLMPEELLSVEALNKNLMYYHHILEPLFFETLNKHKEGRHKKYRGKLWDKIPFLNGGLFDPHNDDYYQFDKVTGLSAQYINTLKVPDDKLKELLGIFETYNFTIDENTSVDIELSIDPEMLGRIFENLLAEINPETGETARRATGSYYTPREIVEYMVDESLKQYLLTKTDGNNETTITSLLKYTDETPKLDEDFVEDVLDALYKIKILDPACGSGAFPMGILQKILLILQKIDPDSKRWLSRILEDIEDETVKSYLETHINADYVHKLGIIRDSIYGVDIQQIAVEISKLRVFLSLIIDETVSDTEPNRGVEPLPNLEFKFVCANTLIGLGENINLTSNKAQRSQRKLEKLRKKYLSSYGQDKLDVIEEYNKTRLQLFEAVLLWTGTNERVRQLSTWNPFEDESCSWFDSGFMYGIKDGFDIIIGNPPYLESRSPKFAAPMKNSYLSSFKQRWPKYPKAISKGADLLVYFFETSIHLVKKDGHVVLITQNSWLDTEYGKKFQEFLIQTTSVKAVIDSDFKYFDSSDGPNINTVITIFKGNVPEPDNNMFLLRFHESFQKVPFSFDSNIRINDANKLTCKFYNYNDSSISNVKWGILLSAEQYVLELIQKLQSKGRRCIDIKNKDLTIGQGLNLAKAYFGDSDLLAQYSFLEKAAIPMMTNDDGAVFELSSTHKFLIDSNKLLPNEIQEIERNGDIALFDINSTKKSKPTLILPRGVSRHFCAINTTNAYSSSYVDIYCENQYANEESIFNLWLFLNSSIAWLLREISGRKNLGGGLLKAEAVDLKSFPIYFEFGQLSQIKAIFTDLRNRQALKTREEINTAEHKQIDEMVFAFLEIGKVDANNITKALENAILSRSSKSKT